MNQTSHVVCTQYVCMYYVCMFSDANGTNGQVESFRKFRSCYSILHTPSQLQQEQSPRHRRCRGSVSLFVPHYLRKYCGISGGHVTRSCIIVANGKERKKRKKERKKLIPSMVGEQWMRGTSSNAQQNACARALLETKTSISNDEYNPYSRD